ncbi:MAG: hypothetical protein XXXJIFNMEKO3_LKCDNKCA_00156 (plasmid) [Candidatus Erwinia impunctatus]
MYGTTRELSQRLIREFHPDEQIFIIPWTKQNVLDVVKNKDMKIETAGKILKLLAEREEYEIYVEGIGEEAVESMSELADHIDIWKELKVSLTIGELQTATKLIDQLISICDMVLTETDQETLEKMRGLSTPA